MLIFLTCQCLLIEMKFFPIFVHFLVLAKLSSFLNGTKFLIISIRLFDLWNDLQDSLYLEYLWGSEENNWRAEQQTFLHFLFLSRFETIPEPKDTETYINDFWKLWKDAGFQIKRFGFTLYKRNTIFWEKRKWFL